MNKLVICKKTDKTGFLFHTAANALLYLPKGNIRTHIKDHYEKLQCNSDDRIFISTDLEPSCYVVKVNKNDMEYESVHAIPFNSSMKPIGCYGLLSCVNKEVGFLFEESNDVLDKFCEHWILCGNTSELILAKYDKNTQVLFISMDSIMRGSWDFIAVDIDKVMFFQLETSVRTTDSAEATMAMNHESTPEQLTLAQPVAANLSTLSNHSLSVPSSPQNFEVIESLVTMIVMNNDDELSRSHIWKQLRGVGWSHINIRNKTNTVSSSAYFPPWNNIHSSTTVDVSLMEANRDYFDELKKVFKYIRKYGMKKVSSKAAPEEKRNRTRKESIQNLQQKRAEPVDTLTANISNPNKLCKLLVNEYHWLKQDATAVTGNWWKHEDIYVAAWAKDCREVDWKVGLDYFWCDVDVATYIKANGNKRAKKPIKVFEENLNSPEWNLERRVLHFAGIYKHHMKDKFWNMLQDLGWTKVGKYFIPSWRAEIITSRDTVLNFTHSVDYFDDMGNISTYIKNNGLRASGVNRRLSIKISSIEDQIHELILREIGDGEVLSQTAWNYLRDLGWQSKNVTNNIWNYSSAYFPNWTNCDEKFTVDISDMIQNRDYFADQSVIARYIKKHGFFSIDDPFTPIETVRQRKPVVYTSTEIEVPPTKSSSKSSKSKSNKSTLPSTRKYVYNYDAIKINDISGWDVTEQIQFLVRRPVSYGYCWSIVWDLLVDLGWGVTYQSILGSERFIPPWGDKSLTSGYHSLDGLKMFIDYFPSRESVKHYLLICPEMVKRQSETYLNQMKEMTQPRRRNSSDNLGTIAPMELTPNYKKGKKRTAEHMESTGDDSSMVLNEASEGGDFAVNHNTVKHLRTSKQYQALHSNIVSGIDTLFTTVVDSPINSFHFCDDEEVTNEVIIEHSEDANDSWADQPMYTQDLIVFQNECSLGSHNKPSCYDQLTECLYDLNNTHLHSTAPGRDFEFGLIKETLRESLRTTEKCNILIQGQPGQGKSHMMRCILDRLFTESGNAEYCSESCIDIFNVYLDNSLPFFKCIQIQGTCSTSRANIFSAIAAGLKLSPRTEETVMKYFRQVARNIKRKQNGKPFKSFSFCMTRSCAMIMLVFEEISSCDVNTINQLLSFDKALDPDEDVNPLIIVGIFNNTSNYNTLLRDNCVCIDIPVYDVSQLKEITQHYLGGMTDEQSVEIIASTVERKNQSDVRALIPLCREILEKRLSMADDVLDREYSPDLLPLIDFKLVMGVIKDREISSL